MLYLGKYVVVIISCCTNSSWERVTRYWRKSYLLSDQPDVMEWLPIIIASWHNVMMMVKEASIPRNTPEWGARLEWREYMAGWSSGMLNIAITFPINKTMFRSDNVLFPHFPHDLFIRQQLHGISVWESLSQLRAEGPLSLYRCVSQVTCCI